mgnify:FL=1|jgi:hypothetical protein
MSPHLLSVIVTAVEKNDVAQMTIQHPKWLRELLDYVRQLELSSDCKCEKKKKKESVYVNCCN